LPARLSLGQRVNGLSPPEHMILPKIHNRSSLPEVPPGMWLEFLRRDLQPFEAT